MNNRQIRFIIRHIATLLMTTLSVSQAMKCYNCQNAPLPRVCYQLTECRSDESCYVEQHTLAGHTLYNSGCMKSNQCPNSSNVVVGTPGIVGKRLTHKNPIECCQHEFCNNEAFGFREIPRLLRGPICFYCKSEQDPSNCLHVFICQRDYLCLLEALSHDYDTTCIEARQCLGDHIHSGADAYACCGSDYCNGNNSTITTVVTTRSTSHTHHSLTTVTSSPTTAVPTKPIFSATTAVSRNTDFSSTTASTITLTNSPPTDSASTSTPAISSTTISDSELIEQACRKLLYQGYFYDSYTNLCVRLAKTNFTRSQAASACAVDGASLMVVDDSTKQDLLIYLIFSHRQNDTDFWIGAKADTVKAQAFHWEDGSELSYKTYNNWGNNLMGQPDDRRVKDENCVYMDFIDNYFWHDDKCSSKKTGYICEIGPLTPQQEEAECRKHVFNGYYYDHRTNFCITLRTNQDLIYTEAEAACARDHAHLVNIDNDGKTNFLLTWIFSNQINQTDFWIGATDKYDNSTFFWTDGRQLQYTHWGAPKFPPVAYGQPDEPRVSNQDCVYMDYIHNYYWYDDNCYNKRKGYICEIPDNGQLDVLCRTHFSQGYFYDFFSNMCIKLYKTAGVTQPEASSACGQESGRLATIDDDKKTNFVLTWIFSHGINDTDFWIGAKDVYNTSTFYWPSGAKLNYTHWYTVNTPPPETCVILGHINNYKWLTAECDRPRDGFICEVNKYTLSVHH